MGTYQPKKIIIVGATSGIGRALAERMMADGHRVGITGRREELLEEMAASHPQQYVYRCFDVTDTVDAVRHMAGLAEALGGVDVVVISAGGGDVNPSLDFGTERRMIDLNVVAFTCLADWAFTYFKRQGHGHLAAITSVAGVRGSRQAPAYSATKAYQIAYLQGLRQKAKKERTGIVVTDLCPGFVDTPAAKSPVRFWVSPVEKAAQQIYQGLFRQRKVVYITRRWRLVAALYRWLPNGLHERL